MADAALGDVSARPDLEGRHADRQHGARIRRADRRARRLPRRELARRHQPDHGQPGLSATRHPDAAARGSFVPARPDHAAARPGDGGLRSRHRFAALPGAGECRVQGFQSRDAAGQVAAAGRAADRHPFARPGSRHRDHRSGLAGRLSLQDRPLRHPAPGQARAWRGGPAL